MLQLGPEKCIALFTQQLPTHGNAQAAKQHRPRAIRQSLVRRSGHVLAVEGFRKHGSQAPAHPLDHCSWFGQYTKYSLGDGQARPRMIHSEDIFEVFPEPPDFGVHELLVALRQGEEHSTCGIPPCSITKLNKRKNAGDSASADLPCALSIALTRAAFTSPAAFGSASQKFVSCTM